MEGKKLETVIQDKFRGRPWNEQTEGIIRNFVALARDKNPEDVMIEHVDDGSPNGWLIIDFKEALNSKWPRYA